MAGTEERDRKVSRRGIFELGSAALAATTLTVAASGRASALPQDQQSGKRESSNETEPGPKNIPLAKENPDSVWPPQSDNGSVKPFKYSFALSRRRVERGG